MRSIDVTPSPRTGFTHASAKAMIASRCFGLRWSRNGSVTSGASVTSGMSSGGAKNASMTDSTAASAASPAAVASPNTATSGVLPFASQSASACLSAALGAAAARSAWRASTSARFFPSASDGVSRSSRFTFFALRKSIAAITSGVRMRPSPSASMSSSMRASKRTPVVGIESAAQHFWSSSARRAMSSPVTNLTWAMRPSLVHFHLYDMKTPFKR